MSFSGDGERRTFRTDQHGKALQACRNYGTSECMWEE